MLELTLTEAAERLDVHYMTVYRYVRIGKLRARKVGREWRVAVDDLEALIASADDPSIGRSGVEWDLRVLDRVIAFDESGAWQSLEAALGSGLTPIKAYTDVMVPVLGNLGRQWESGEISMAVEHGATSVCRRLVARLGQMVGRPGWSKGTVVFGCVPGERHQLAGAIAADVFRASGYDVIEGGAYLPIDGVAELATTATQLVAVGLSATNTGHDQEIAEAVSVVRRAVPDTLIIVGGRGVAVGTGDVNADATFTTALDGVEFIGRVRTSRPDGDADSGSGPNQDR